METNENRYLTQSEWEGMIRSLITPEEFQREFLNEWYKDLNPMPVYILASNYQIAKSIFKHYFVNTQLSRSTDLRYIDDVHKLYGLRNIFIVISDERYPSESFYDRLLWIRRQELFREFEVVYEQDLAKGQVREKVSRQRQKTSEG